MPKNKTIHIIGAGLVGLNIASRIQSVLSVNQSSSHILVHDQATSILSSWNSKLCGGYHLNNGFHGIEMPRAHLVADFLNQSGCGPLLCKAPNHRLLVIEGNEVLFNTTIGDWPNSLKNGLEDLFMRYSRTEQPIEIINDALLSTRIGQSIAQCYTRFSEDIGKCWHLFFPWFFPPEFSFQTEDEGGDFQDKVRTKNVNASYLFPKRLIFEELKVPIAHHLESRGVSFSLGHSFSYHDLEELTSSSADRIVWCASSFGLLNILDKSLAKNCISSVRHMHLALYSVSYNAISALQERMGVLPTEILVLDPEVAELNRLSFFDYLSATSDSPPSVVLLVAEYFTIDKCPNDDILLRIKAYLKRHFSSYVELIGKAYGRPMYTLDAPKLGEASNLLENYASEKGIDLPYIYYGPINMAKCATIANEYIVASLP